MISVLIVSESICQTFSAVGLPFERWQFDTVVFCKILLLFSFETEIDTEIKRHECAIVSLLWEYDEGRPGTKYFPS
jgi:hypothetical protein